jgi:hypothetical protein
MKKYRKRFLVTFRLKEDERKQLKIMAYQQNATVENYIRAAIGFPLSKYKTYARSKKKANKPKISNIEKQKEIVKN